MAENELWFTALGPSGAGKTTMLACMYKKFEEILPGSIIADTGTFSTLQASYEKLREEANGPALEFGIGIENTENLREYAFTIKGKSANVPVRFFDFPGGWMDPAKSQAENFKRVIDIVKRSRVIIVAVSTPYLMEARERYRKEARIDDIEYVIQNSMLDSEGSKLILIVPIKCEKYTRNDRDRAKLFAQIEKVFASTLTLASNPSYKDKLAVAVIPIHTVGNAQFSRFEAQEEGRLPREIYLKNRGMGFRPKDADQPLRYAISFLLNEFARDNSSSLSGVFSRNDIKELGDFIRNGMKTNDSDGIKIYCGRELITEMPDIVEGNNSYMFKKQDDEPESQQQTFTYEEIISAPPAKQEPQEQDDSNDSMVAYGITGTGCVILGAILLEAAPLLALLVIGVGIYGIYKGMSK